MSRQSFENYGRIAEGIADYTVVSGRYKIQEEAAKNIIKDILDKLDLKTNDTVLEIGCGGGNILIPLSFMVSEITGIDHVSCLELLRKRFPEDRNIRLIPGNFLDISLENKFTKILVYSVLHYLKDETEVFNFIEKALELLLPGGKALFGDIPNKSAKERFVYSKSGAVFSKKWQKLTNQTENIKQEQDRATLTISDQETVQFDDSMVLKILKQYRQKGFHAYLLSQPHDLPFGNTREDILFVKVD